MTTNGARENVGWANLIEQRLLEQMFAIAKAVKTNVCHIKSC